MRTRLKGYEDYGITEEGAKAIMARCKSPEAFHALIEAAEKANPEICIPLAYSLAYGVSYERLYAWSDIPYSAVDFYGYRRKTLWLLKNKLDEAGKNCV